MAPASPPARPLYFSEQLLAGGVAGLTELVIMYPLDVVKTRAQASIRDGVPMVKTLVNIISKEKIGVYRGILFPILAETPKRALKLGCFSQFFQRLEGHVENGHTRALIAGVIAGVIEGTLVCAPELIKIRMQVPENKVLYSNSWNAGRMIPRSEGVSGLFKGLCATWLRNGLWNGAYFGSIFTVKSVLQRWPDMPDFQRNLIAGSVAGAIGTVFNTPADVVKTRLQNNHALAMAKPELRVELSKMPQKTFPAMLYLAKTEGFSTLWRGFIPKVARLGPGGGIMLCVFEGVMEKMRSR
eukprot:GEMP01039523.1.p1 GENE.GEMP01039523.1~~GEMP01039523.1.p1  ORF type:complete len:298 (+),score=55.52 GEMP01039523.1:224-1117(+)